jgi:alpha-beta hydrolase superfamily lysophospholipase
MSKKPALPIPTLMLSAGMEMVVGVEEQDKVCKRTIACSRKVFEHSYHEILFERDEIRDQAVEEIALFINNAL